MKTIVVKKKIPAHVGMEVIGGKIELGGKIIPDSAEIKFFNVGEKYIIECPNCKEDLEIGYRKKIIYGKCESCDEVFIRQGEDLDYIQPNFPFFNRVYPNSQYEKDIKQQAENKKRKLNLKDERDINLKLKVKQGRLKPWELEEVKKIAEEQGID